MNCSTMSVAVAVAAVVAIAFVARERNAVLAQPVKTKWEQSVQICGSQLTDLMISICKTDSYDPEKTDHVPINRRQKRKIIEECCKVPCTYGHMYENYCDHQAYDTETEYVSPDNWPRTHRTHHAADGNPVSTTSSAAGSTASFVTSTVASTPPADAVVPTTDSSWFERFLNGLKFW